MFPRGLHAAFVLGVALGSGGCKPSADGAAPSASASGSAAGPKKPPAFPVDVAVVQAESVDYLVTAVGSIEAAERIDITARVAGVVERVRFQEGDTVKAGAVLAEIEPGRYALAADQSRATSRRAEASAKDAASLLARRVKLAEDGVASTEELDGARTKVAVAEAEVALAKASLGLAQLNLRDAFVRAPEGGVVQTRTVHTGQYVQPGTVLATLLRRDPLRLRFELPEHEARGVRPGVAVRFTVRGEAAQRNAKLRYVADSASDRTRMVEAIADVEGVDVDLRPGTFAEVSIVLASTQAAPVIPQMAARPTAKGFVAFVVEDGVAKERLLTLGKRTVDGRVEVKDGLRAGEKLVLRGGEALRDGAAVRLGGAPPAPPASGSAGPARPPAPPSAAPSASAPRAP